MLPYSLYIFDFITRLLYFLFSYILCWLLMFNFIETIFLFEIYPLVSILPKKRFILTQVTHLFHTVWSLTFFLSSTFVYPLFVSQVKQFWASSWYSYQLKLYAKITLYTFNFFLFLYFCTHLILITNFLSFFLYWEVLDDFSLLRIEAEISLYYYIIWIISLKFSISSFLLIVSSLLFISFYVFDLHYVFYYILLNKKILLFFLVLLLLFLVPPDLLTQILLTLLSIIVIEFIFFLICVKYSTKKWLR